MHLTIKYCIKYLNKKYYMKHGVHVMVICLYTILFFKLPLLYDTDDGRIVSIRATHIYLLLSVVTVAIIVNVASNIGRREIV